jgi:hypothetical protein
MPFSLKTSAFPLVLNTSLFTVYAVIGLKHKGKMGARFEWENFAC